MKLFSFLFALTVLIPVKNATQTGVFLLPHLRQIIRNRAMVLFIFSRSCIVFLFGDIPDKKSFFPGILTIVIIAPGVYF